MGAPYIYIYDINTLRVNTVYAFLQTIRYEMCQKKAREIRKRKRALLEIQHLIVATYINNSEERNTS